MKQNLDLTKILAETNHPRTSDEIHPDNGRNLFREGTFYLNPERYFRFYHLKNVTLGETCWFPEGYSQ